MVGFFNGISMGGGVVIARYYGAKNDEKVHKAVHTSVAFALIAGILLTVIGVLLAPQILVLMGTAEVLVNSVVYFRVYFCGSLAFVLYNTMMGILQSIGDSKHPLMYLIISSIINIILDLIFVGVFHLGVGYAALATIISQFTSGAMSEPSLPSKDILPDLSEQNSYRQRSIPSDYFKRCSVRSTELYYFFCKCDCSV